MATWLLIALLSLSPLSAFAKRKPAQAGPQPDWAYVQKKLKAAGFKSLFIQELKESYQDKHFHEVLELNLLLFLRKSDYHGPQASTNAADHVRKFLKKNKTMFKKAEDEFGVKPEVIASLLWIESRHGVNKGHFHVASAYVHLLQAPRPEVLEHLQAKATEFTKHVTAKQRKEIAKRTKRKADWALAELKAVEKMYKQDKSALALKGSFSGAFGMPQFIPSSYVAYAATTRSKKAPDLMRADDSIYSVAHYLRKNGWRKGKKASFAKALMKYNNSSDYVKAILRIAKSVESPAGQRTPARALPRKPKKNS